MVFASMSAIDHPSFMQVKEYLFPPPGGNLSETSRRRLRLSPRRDPRAMHVAGVNGELEAPPLATVWRGLDEAPVALRSDHMDAGDGWPLLFSHDDDVRLFNHFATSLSFFLIARFSLSVISLPRSFSSSPSFSLSNPSLGECRITAFASTATGVPYTPDTK